MEKSKHSVVYTVILIGLIMLVSFPGFFDWANRIEPFVLGLPFVMFWVLSICFCMCLVMAAWYYTDSIKGVGFGYRGSQ